MTNKYKYKVTELIAEAFEKHKLKFSVDAISDLECVRVHFSFSDCSPFDVLFISDGNKNNVTVRIDRLIRGISQEKKARMLEACNILNCEYRFFRYFIDSDGDLNVQYDYPTGCSDDCVGDISFEIILRAIKAMTERSQLLMKAFYSNESLT